MFAAAKRHGLTAVQVPIGTPEDVARLDRSSWRDGIRQRCGESGVRISCLALNIVEHIAICGKRSNAMTRRQFRAIFSAALEFASEASIPLIYVPSFGVSEMITHDCLLETAELLARSAESASQLRIEVASENALGPAATSRLIDLVALDNFKILFDVFNPLRWGHSPMDIVAANFDSFASQIHVKDGRLPGYGNVALGSGQGEIVRIVRELRWRGFDGMFVFENDYRKGTGCDLRTDVQTMRMIWGA